MAGTVEQAQPSGQAANEPQSGVTAGTGSAQPAAIQPAAGQLAALQSLVRRASQPSDPSELIRDAMLLAVKVIGADLWSSAQMATGGKLVVMVHPAERVETPEQAARPAVHTIPLAAGESLAGQAMRVQAPISVKDLQLPGESDDGFLRKMGVRAALVVPIFLAGEPYGAVALYRREPRGFTPDQVAFLESAAFCLTPAIARSKAEKALSDQRRFVSALLESIDTLVLVLDADGNVEGINRACRELAGFSLTEIRDKPFCSVFAIPEEEDLFRKTFRRSVNNKKGCRFESTLLGKDGARHKVAWSLKLVVDKNAFVQAILLTGTDQTEFAQTCDKLAQAQAVAREATAAVRDLRRQLAEQPLQGRAPQAESQEPTGHAAPAAAGPEGNEGAARPSGPERRSSPRRAYHYRQLIAPVVGGQLPASKSFIEVECEDISAGGLSFYFAEQPNFEQVVVALGQPPFMTHLKADVVRVVEASDESGMRFLVGCRFTGRVYL